MAPFAMLASAGKQASSALVGVSRRALLAHRRAEAQSGTDGAINLNAGLLIVGVIVGAVVGMAILAALVPTFLTSLADVNDAFNDPNATTGDATADTLLPIFPILIGLGGLAAIVGLALLTINLRKGKGSV